MNIDFVQIFNDSYSRTSQESSFFDDFYALFLSMDPDIEARLANTDMRKQKKMIRLSLIYMVNFFVQKKSSDDIERLAKLHNKNNMDVPPELYPLWLSALLEAVKKHDPYYDDQTELSWRIILARGIEYMKFYYDK
jgi:hemoglobin-like flavoprotein